MPNDPQPQKAQSSLTNPQVITAIIGGVVTLVAAILGFLPAVLNRPAEATEVRIVTATPMPTILSLSEPTLAPTDVPAAQPTAVIPTTVIEPTAVPASPIPPTPIPPTPVPPTAAPSQPPNALLMWDDVSFTALNQSGGGLFFGNIVFRSASGSFDARVWGSSLPYGYCLRLRDVAAGQRTPPSECGGNLYSLLEVSGSSFFWRNVDAFDVVLGGQVIATCPTAAGRCGVYVG